MKVLIKVGGTLLDSAASRAAIAGQLASLTALHQLTVVHGGGKQLTSFLAGQGIASRFVDGLRISDEAVIDAATKVIAGTVNKQFVSSLAAAGVAALGISGVDGGLTRAAQFRAELAFVGQPQKSNGPLLDLLVAAGYLPVIACLAGDSQGNILNVNADQMAVSCATAFRAEKLIFLTDVPGVKDAAGELLPRLSSGEAGCLIRSGVAHGGMQAKLQAASQALAEGVQEVIIADGREQDICRRIFERHAPGTRLTADEASTVGVTS